MPVSLVTTLISCSSSILAHPLLFFFFFFNDTATTEIYTLSLHDALPISESQRISSVTLPFFTTRYGVSMNPSSLTDRKSTRLNSSHLVISYAVFCLKKKKKQNIRDAESAVVCE